MIAARYIPFDIQNWVELGTGTLQHGRPPVKVPGGEIGKSVGELISRAVRTSQGAVANLKVKRIDQIEYRLSDDFFEIEGGARIDYADIKRIEHSKKSGFRIYSSFKEIEINPYAWLKVGSVEVPLGWLRDGLEVPFELLVQEIGIRAKVELMVG